MQTNATHSFVEVSTLNGDRHNGFAFGTAATLSGSRRADEKFIHFDATGQFFASIADGAASKLLQPGPGGSVAAKAQQLFQINRIDAGFAPDLRVVNHHMALNQ